MADGSLPVDNFKHYLIQDYLFLVRCVQHCVRNGLKLGVDTLRKSQRAGVVQIQVDG